jgi:hypothetical protein
MKNRWSDAARAAALAVRKARAFAANPRGKGQGAPKRGGLARKAYPMAYAGGSATFDENTGTRNNPGKHVWIPPNGGVGTQYEEGMKALVAKKNFYVDAKGVPQPNIFYSSTGPKGPLDRQTPQGIRYDPKNPDHPQSPMPPKRPPGGKGKNIPRVEIGRVIIGGKRYTRVGNKLTPDEIIPGQKYKVFYQK